MNKQKNIPQLRFPDFNGEWSIFSLAEIAKFSKGKGISKEDISDSGETECIRYGELYTTYNETIDTVYSKTNIDTSDLVLSEGNDIIIPASGETQIDIAKASCVLKSGIALGGDLNIIKSPNNGVFLSYYLNSKKKIDIAKLAQGISVVHLYAGQLSKLQLRIPSLPEQQKIASFFTAIDQKISQLKRKKTLLEQYKKGVMQKIFSQEIRFKDDNGKEFPKWEKKKLGDVCQVKRGASPRPITDAKWFSDNSSIGWVRISDVTKSSKYLNKTEQYLSEKGISKSRYVQKGNMIMSICATIGSPIYTNINVCIHDGFVVFENLKLEKEYLFYYLDFIKNKWYQYGQPGTQINLNSEIVSNEFVIVPCRLEQSIIANFLSAIDDKINHTQKKIDKADAWKKGLMQQMFV